MSGEAAIPAFIAVECGRSRERTPPSPPSLPHSTEGTSFTCTALTAQLCHEERSAFVPFGGLSNLDGDSASLAFTAREVLSLSGILLSVRNAFIAAAPGEKVPSSECARTDEGVVF